VSAAAAADGFAARLPARRLAAGGGRAGAGAAGGEC